MTSKSSWRDSGVSRREVMRLGAGGLGFSLFGGIGPVPHVLSQASRAAAGTTSGRILVVFEWFGGNDGLNTIVPYGDAAVLQAPADDRPEGSGAAEDRRAVRPAQVDAGDEAPVRRRQGGDHPRRGLRPAVVLALHFELVLAHRGPQQRQRVRVARPHRVGARSRRHARRPHRQHLRQPGAGRAGRAPRAAGVHRPDPLPARGVRAGEAGARGAQRAARPGGRRASLRAGGQPQRGPGLRGGAGRLEQVQGQGQSRPAAARSRQGGGAHRGRLPDPALLRAAAQQPVRHPRQPGLAARSPAPLLLGRHRRLLPGDGADRPGRRRRDVRLQRVRPAGAREHQPRHRPRHGPGQLRHRQRGEGRLLRDAAEPHRPGARRQPRQHHRLPPGVRQPDRRLAGRGRGEGAGQALRHHSACSAPERQGRGRRWPRASVGRPGRPVGRTT